MTEYRSLREGEWDEAMRLWTGVFEVPGWLFQTLNDSTTGRKLEHTSVAVEDGRIVSAVDVFMRQVRWIDGEPRLMGGIGSVATYPEARQKGHSGRLLEMAVAMMKKEGCVWSFLFTGVNAHYAKYGWKDLAFPQRVGTLSATAAKVSSGWNIEPFKLEHLQDLIRIHTLYNAQRPLSMIRTPAAWEISLPPRLTDKNVFARVATSDGIVKAYAVSELNKDEAQLLEVGYELDAETSIPGLVEAVRVEAANRKLKQAVSRLASDPVVDRALDTYFESSEQTGTSWTMARPIADDVSFQDLERLVASPGARHWQLDGF